jgi:hemerythrin superfamily protein
MRATDLLHGDHQTVEQLFEQLGRAPRGDHESRQTVLDRIADELEIHSKIEEEIFYPALRRVSGQVDEAVEEHREVSTLIGAVEGEDPGSDEFASKVEELERAVQHHVFEEEGEMFRAAQKLGDPELERLGQQLAERKQTLKTSIVQRGLRAAKLAARKIS